MTLILEISHPIQWRPWIERRTHWIRVGWLWVAVAWLRVPLDEVIEGEWEG